MRPLLLLFGLIIFIALCAFWFLSKRADTASTTLPPTKEVVNPIATLEPLEHQQRRQAKAEAAPGIKGLVRTTDGKPIRSASVVCRALRWEDVASPQAWPLTESKEADYGSLTATGDDGSFEFASLPDLPYGAAVIAMHPDYMAGGLDLPSGSNEWPARVEIILGRGTPIAVQVVDIAGKPQPGATVHHIAKPRRPTSEDSRPIQAYERFLAQDGVTDTVGRAQLAPFSGEQLLWANRGELVSVPWQGTSPSDVTLTLGESFSLAGTISLVGDPPRENAFRILVSGLAGNLWKRLACLNHAQSEWGPLRIPLSGIARYEVRLEGA